ncbi:MAG: glutathione S-transferase family protein [Pseudomonadales bacterium]
MIRLYTHPFSIVPRRVCIALHEKGLAFESVETDLYTKAPTPEFLALNPFAQIPVLDDGGFVVAESMAILEYLEEHYPAPALLPSDIQLRATARKLMCWGTDYWPPAWKQWMAPRLPEHLANPWTDATVAEGRRDLCAHLDVLEQQLTGNDWLVGLFSLADVCYAPLVLVLDRVDLGEEIERREQVKAWVERLMARPSVFDTLMPTLR